MSAAAEQGSPAIGGRDPGSSESTVSEQGPAAELWCPAPSPYSSGHSCSDFIDIE